MLSTASGTALRIAARTCSSFDRNASGCAAMYSSTDLGTLCFIPLILCADVQCGGGLGNGPLGASRYDIGRALATRAEFNKSGQTYLRSFLERDDGSSARFAIESGAIMA